jgi:hypothetical protein
MADTITASDQEQHFPAVIGGDAIVHYATLTSHDSIFQKEGSRPVGYIRLTRFSSTATAGYINAINSLEAAGVDSYIIDLRNNYGGVIQEAMLTASTLLRDPHSVLCYTLNSRGGFRPQETESRTAVLDQVKREHPEYLKDGWSSPTSYASLRELKLTRGIKPARSFSFISGHVGAGLKDDLKTEDSYVTEKKHIDLEKLAEILNQNSQKKLVILINEGTGEILLACMYCSRVGLFISNPTHSLFHTSSIGSRGFRVCASRQWQNSRSSRNENFWERLDSTHISDARWWWASADCCRVSNASTFTRDQSWRSKI